MTRRKVRLGLVQMRMQEGQEDNLEKGVAIIERATSGGASIVCLPELFTTKYSAYYESAGKVPAEILDTMCSQLGNPTQIELIGKLQQELGLYRI